MPNATVAQTGGTVAQTRSQAAGYGLGAGESFPLDLEDGSGAWLFEDGLEMDYG